MPCCSHHQTTSLGREAEQGALNYRVAEASRQLKAQTVAQAKRQPSLLAIRTAAPSGDARCLRAREGSRNVARGGLGGVVATVLRLGISKCGAISSAPRRHRPR